MVSEEADLNGIFDRLRMNKGLCLHLSANPAHMEGALSVRLLEVTSVFHTSKMVRQIQQKGWTSSGAGASLTTKKQMQKLKKMSKNYLMEKVTFKWYKTLKSGHCFGTPVSLNQPIWTYEGFLTFVMDSKRHWAQTSSDEWITNKDHQDGTIKDRPNVDQNACKKSLQFTNTLVRISDNNFAICSPLEIPLRGFPFQMNL